MITKITTPSAINACLQYPLEGTGVQTDPFDWYTKATVVDTVSTVTVVETGDYDSIEKYFNIKLTASQLYTFSINGVDDMSTTVTVYYEGTQVAQSVFDDMEWTWGLSYTPSTTGTYLIKVSTYSYGSAGTVSVTPVPGEITPWIEKASGVFESTGFDMWGRVEQKYSFREQRLLLPNDLYVSGNNQYSQLGMGNQTNLGGFTLNPNALSLKQVSNCNSLTVAIDQYGRLFAWGNYEYSGSAGSPVPIQIGDRSNWVRCMVGHDRVLVLDSDKKLWQVSVWDGAFTEIPFAKGIVQINMDTGGWSPGTYYAIDTDGSLWVWGKNNNGTMGFGDTTDRANPTKHDNYWKSAAMGSYHTLAVKSDGTLWSSGRHSSGQLGLGESGNVTALTQVGVATNWEKVFAYSNSSFAVNSLGELYACGWNFYGCLGLGDTTQRSSFEKVGDYNTDIFISGSDFTTMLLYNGIVYLAGENSNSGISGTSTFTSVGLSNCINCNCFYNKSLGTDNEIYFIIKRRSV